MVRYEYTWDQLRRHYHVKHRITMRLQDVSAGNVNEVTKIISVYNNREMPGLELEAALCGVRHTDGDGIQIVPFNVVPGQVRGECEAVLPALCVVCYSWTCCTYALAVVKDSSPALS